MNPQNYTHIVEIINLKNGFINAGNKCEKKFLKAKSKETM